MLMLKLARLLSSPSTILIWSAGIGDDIR